MKRLALRAEMLMFGRAYCASPHDDQQMMDSVDDLADLSFPVPWKSGAQRAAARHEARTGQPWRVTKWIRP